MSGGKIIPFVDTIPADNAIYRLVTTKIDDLIAYRVKEGA